MKIRYDQDVDALTIILKQDIPVDESDEILNASLHMPDVTTLEYQLTPKSPRRSA